ncbi:hypothetical protein WMY93_019633 [Mugilogobius chulae]|uniref:Uncharacterized protein n=1 Tax=Mugilogobius chulae TaxID=88201 RepID=A0AAW0NQ18_9GOBI
MQKIKSLMARQGLKSPQENMADLSPVESLRIPSQEEMRELREQPLDPAAEQDIIDSIEEVYFSSDSFDMVQHELESAVRAEERGDETPNKPCSKLDSNPLSFDPG